MPRSPRKVISGKFYELILRVSDKIPFVPLETINLILKSALARTQRDFKVTVCHFLWMGNHVHMLFIPWDAAQCANFYQELQKKITDSFKSLLGVDYLSLWDGSPVLAPILDLEMAIDRISYAYSNPASANLVECIEKYPGLSSYKAFLSSGGDSSYSSIEKVPWIRMNKIQKLPSLALKPFKDEEIAKTLKESSRLEHQLKVEPNAWMHSFGITLSGEIAEINKRILQETRKRELEAEKKRKVEKKYVLGAIRLKQTAIMSKCKSKKRERRVYVFSSIKELRIAYILEFKEFVRKCRECYLLLKQGILRDWPPGAFRPPAPPLSSAIA